ncbi:NAD(P)H-binding protein [Actinomyces ruminicola]|uniref:Putative NADH-flavin reductase n=1 Tax=Actinomyces ruminicola TaxID=332524 RepID=A0A1G9Z7N3_9ACTO|nr:NAD(P)H-binding protein [Actinomyces ruminicola]SDN17115.1 Putative NADH-flavin reductase [Actinomyces ruminicola]
MSRIVIVGGHGKVALLLAPLLVQRGDDVVSLIRNPEQADEVAATGATPLVVSVEDASQQELAAAFAGADAVVWSAGAGGKGGLERTTAVDRDAAIRSMEAARAASVPRYVMVSFAGSHGEDPVPAEHPLRTYAMAKLAADRHLVASDLDWTIVGPGLLTLDEPTGRIGLGREGDAAQAPTSRANVAAVIAAVLAEPASIGKVIPFRDGETPIAEAIAEVPAEFADLDS